MTSKEIQLIELKEKIKKAEKEDNSQDSYLWGVIFGCLTFIFLAVFIWYKKILDEYWYYGSGLFGIMALISLILIFCASKWEKQAKEKLKKLKKQEKELKEVEI